KTSRKIVDYCVGLTIDTIVIGKNNGWKQNVNMGKKNNQKFVFIPFNKLISQIQYKAEDVGIRVVIIEEPYTSKCSYMDFEYPDKQHHYVGKRVTRGLFRSTNGTKEVFVS
ncbi:MAG: IS200/IS605 family element transposase accessory protein TnpB, partial [Candidatus Heimdallarchaeota archaeon]|nr:IS200/IS605 family element transposase accessory protein TnpB [Candidatus Heimdallarchaeota archaeon]